MPNEHDEAMQTKRRKNIRRRAHRAQSLSRRKYKFTNKCGEEEELEEEDWTELGGKTKKSKKRSRTDTDDENGDDVVGIRSTRFARFAFTHTRSTPCTVFMHIQYPHYEVRVGAVPSLHMLRILYTFSQRLALVVGAMTAAAAAFQPLLSIRLTLPFPHRNNIHSAFYAPLLSVNGRVFVGENKRNSIHRLLFGLHLQCTGSHQIIIKQKRAKQTNEAEESESEI